MGEKKKNRSRILKDARDFKGKPEGADDVWDYHLSLNQGKQPRNYLDELHMK